MLRQQNSERMSLERELLEQEDKALATKIQSTHAERQQILDDAATQLAEKLQGTQHRL